MKKEMINPKATPKLDELGQIVLSDGTSFAEHIATLNADAGAVLQSAIEDRLVEYAWQYISQPLKPPTHNSESLVKAGLSPQDAFIMDKKIFELSMGLAELVAASNSLSTLPNNRIRGNAGTAVTRSATPHINRPFEPAPEGGLRTRINRLKQMGDGGHDDLDSGFDSLTR